MKRYPANSSGIWRAYIKRLDLMLIFLPCLVFLIVFKYVPMGGVIIAFKSFRMDLGILRSPWVGWDNFVRLFNSQDFPNALINTIVISLLSLAFGFCAPIILALMLNEVRLTAFKKGIQTITYLPYFFSWVVLGGIFLMLFDPNGPINDLLAAAGGPRLTFMSDDRWFLVVLIGTRIWHGVGYGAVIYLAALAGIPPQLYEAAMVDGAGRWRQTLAITLPSLIPTMVVLFILNLGHILQAGFDQVYNLYNPLVYDVADIIDTYVLRRMQAMEFGLATAADLFKSVVGLILIVMVNSFTRWISRGEHGVW